MSNDKLTLSGNPTGLSTELRQVAEDAREYVRESIPASTKRAYTTDWATFSEWCRQHRLPALPAAPSTVALFAADRAKAVRPTTIRRALAAIAKMHKVSGHASPCASEPVPSTIKGIERTHGANVQGKAPADLSAVEKMLTAYPPTTLDGLRNRALLLIGFAGAFRRGELVAIEVRDLEWSDKGVVITVRHSKTDQRGVGLQKPIPFVQEGVCAATALRAWLVAGGVKEGPVFRPMNRLGQPKPIPLNPQSVGLIIKVACERAGLDPKKYSGHSLRAGHVTEARARGVSDADTMSVTGHKRVETLNLYDRRGNPFDKTSAGSVLAPRK
jgi:site-specific recombinase XerD